jgi:hypothetical protein
LTFLERLLLADSNTEAVIINADGSRRMLWSDNKLGRLLSKVRLRVRVPRVTGFYGPTGYSHNVVTNIGHAAAAGRLGGLGSYSTFVNLAIGSGSTAAAATDTALGTEISTNGGARGAATATQVTTGVTNDTLQLVKTWTASGAGFTANEEGIFDNATTGGNMLARQIIGPYTLAAGDTLTITHRVQA